MDAVSVLSFKDLLVGLGKLEEGCFVFVRSLGSLGQMAVVSICIPKHMLACRLSQYLWFLSALLTPPPYHKILSFWAGLPFLQLLILV